MKKILLIDDNEIDLAIGTHILEEKFNVIIAKSGKDALNQLSNGLIPDMILLDIIMPEMSGWETLVSLKGISLLWDIPIIIITSLDSEVDKEQAVRLGAADFISKPITKDDLLHRIEVIFEKRELKNKAVL